MKTAVFLPNWIGDVVMATPALRVLRRHFSDAHFIGVMRPYVADVLAGTGWLDEKLLYDPRARDKSLRQWSLVRQLQRRRVDMAILLTNSFRTGLLALAGGAKTRVGYARGGRGLLLNKKLKAKTTGGRLVPVSALDSYLELAYLVGCPHQPPRTELATLPEDEAAADAVWQKLALPPGKRVVVFHFGGGWGGVATAKSWPAEHFARLAARITCRHDMAVLVICGPAEIETAAAITQLAASPHVKSLAGETLSIGLSKACVRRSRLMVSTDSGPRHFAAAFDVPVVTLYGPTHVAWGDTHYDRAINLNINVPCGPCMKRVCPFEHHMCMRDLSVEDVYKAVVRLLDDKGESQAA